MDPQLKSVLTSAGMLAAGGVATWAASHGFVGQDDEANLTNALVTVGSAAIAGAFAWWKARSNSQPALIKAVNQSDNGVKVVASSAPAPQVNAPLK